MHECSHTFHKAINATDAADNDNLADSESRTVSATMICVVMYTYNLVYFMIIIGHSVPGQTGR